MICLNTTTRVRKGIIINLHERLKLIRRKRGLSQRELASMLKVTRQAVSQWENGYTYPDLDNLIILSDVYEVSLDIMIKGTD
ncbi:helix-turn-helix domain-containing protein [Lactiplantibacillus plantarum]|uniref:helix-turn-helix domain-containing protein n=1 Tax=Lactiplantibacillus plantarum TaxID=1590 RepID=UPI0036D31B65